jgi:hypothetical protein
MFKLEEKNWRGDLEMVEEFPDVEKRVGLASRLLAAVWFAFTACVPIVYFFGFYEQGFWSNPNAFFDNTITLFIGLPICLAAFFGFTIGSKILDEQRITPGLAALLALSSPSLPTAG